MVLCYWLGSNCNTITLSNFPINDMETLSSDHKVSIHLHKVSILVLNGKVTMCSCCLQCWWFGSNYTRQGEGSETFSILSSLCHSYRLAKCLESTPTSEGEAGRKQTKLLETYWLTSEKFSLETEPAGSAQGG